MSAFDPEDYWESRLKQNFGLQGTGYIGLGKNYNKWMYKIRRKVLLRKTKAMCIDFNNSDILDIGSGTGFYIDIWKELGGKRIVGTDITKTAVENLKLRYPGCEFCQSDIGGEDIKHLDTRKYDIISAFDVLFHIVDDERYERAILNIRTLLKPNGFFIFSDNFLHSKTQRSTNQVMRSLDFTKKILINNGFNIVERCPMMVLMSTPVDSCEPLLKIMWNVISSLVHLHEAIGFVIGGILYPVELILISFMQESPTTEMMICRRSN